jgi:hypothetical protein
MAINGPTVIMGYSAGGGYTLVVTSLNTGISRTFPGTSGRPSPKTAVITGGKLILGSGDPGYLLECDGDTVRTIGKCGDRDYYTAALAPDGRVFLGTFPRGTLEIYSPADGTIARVGEFDATFTEPQYVYTLVTDGRYAYAGMGQDPWYLAVIDTQTGQAAQYFKADARTGGVNKAADGSGLFYGVYELIDGAPMVTRAPPAMKPWYKPNNVTIDKSGFASAGVDIDLDNANVATGITPELRWKQGADTGWQSATFSNVATASAIIKRAVSVGNRILIVSGFYGPLAWYDETTGAMDTIGWTNRSLYDALPVGSDVYLSGYTAVTLRWDTSQPWTLTPSALDLLSTNPRQVAGWHKYHYFQALDRSGVLWVGVNHERDSVGGELGWYEPATEKKGSLREDFLNWPPRALAVVGDWITYSSDSLDGADGRVFVVDTKTRGVLRSYSPVVNATDAGVIIAVSTTDVVGVTGATAYRLNLTDGEVLWTKTLPAAAFGMSWYDRRIAVAPDGWLWFAIGNAIHKLNPADGKLIQVAATDAPYNVCFHQGGVYLYGGTQLLRLKPA